MIVTVPLEALEHRLAGHGIAMIDGRYRVSADTARRLACDAAVIPAVLGTHGEILDLGRKTRTVTAAQRRAVIARDRHCAYPGCRRSPRRCDIHHVIPWAWGGPTDLDHLVLLCPAHHHRIHHSQWAIHLIDGRAWFIPPAHIDPHRQPRANHVHTTHTAA